MPPSAGATDNALDHNTPMHLGGDQWDRAELQVPIVGHHHIEKTWAENRRAATPPEAVSSDSVKALLR